MKWRAPSARVSWRLALGWRCRRCWYFFDELEATVRGTDVGCGTWFESGVVGGRGMGWVRLGVSREPGVEGVFGYLDRVEWRKGGGYR